MAAKERRKAPQSPLDVEATSFTSLHSSGRCSSHLCRQQVSCESVCVLMNIESYKKNTLCESFCEKYSSAELGYNKINVTHRLV